MNSESVPGLFSLYVSKSSVLSPSEKLIYDSICNLFCLYHCVVSSPSTIMNVLPEPKHAFSFTSLSLEEEIG